METVNMINIATSLATIILTVVTVYFLVRKNVKESEAQLRESVAEFSEQRTEFKRLKNDHIEHKKETKERFERVENKISMKLDQIFSLMTEMRVELKGVSKDTEHLKKTQSQQEQELKKVQRGKK